MDLMSIGSSMGAYIKNMSMEQKWKMKKRTGDFSADGTKTVSQWVEEQKRKFDGSSADKPDKKDSTLQSIHNKMSAGQKLTASEKQYLQKKDPETYKKLRDIEAEQEKYERDLKRCKTKEEVHKLKMTHVAQSLSTVNTVKNDPYIPEGKKLEIIMGEQQKMKAIEQSTTEFAKSGRYDALPTEAEKREAEKILKEAEEAKLHPEKPEKEEAETPETELREDIADTSGAVKTEASQSEAKEAVLSDKSDYALAKAEKTVKAYEKARAENIKKKKPAQKSGLSAEAKAIVSPAVRKVKRAKNPYPADRDKTPQGMDVSLGKVFEAKG